MKEYSPGELSPYAKSLGRSPVIEKNATLNDLMHVVGKDKYDDIIIKLKEKMSKFKDHNKKLKHRTHLLEDELQVNICLLRDVLRDWWVHGSFKHQNCPSIIELFSKLYPNESSKLNLRTECIQSKPHPKYDILVKLLRHVISLQRHFSIFNDNSSTIESLEFQLKDKERNPSTHQTNEMKHQIQILTSELQTVKLKLEQLQENEFRGGRSSPHRSPKSSDATGGHLKSGTQVIESKNQIIYRSEVKDDQNQSLLLRNNSSSCNIQNERIQNERNLGHSNSTAMASPSKLNFGLFSTTNEASHALGTLISNETQNDLCGFSVVNAGDVKIPSVPTPDVIANMLDKSQYVGLKMFVYELNKQVILLRRQNEDKRMRLDAKGQLIEKLREKLKESRFIIFEAQKSACESKENIEDAQSKLERTREEMKALLAADRELKAEWLAMKSELEQLRKKVSDENQEFILNRRRLESSQNKVNHLTEEARELQKKIEIFEETINEKDELLKQELVKYNDFDSQECQLNDKINQLKLALDKKEETIQLVNSSSQLENSNMKAKLIELEKIIQQQAEEISQLKEKPDIESIIEIRLTGERVKHQDLLQNLEKDFEEKLSAQVENYREHELNFNCEILALTKKLNETQQESDLNHSEELKLLKTKLSNEKTVLFSENEGLKMISVDLRQKVDDYELNQQKLQNQILCLKEELQKLKDCKLIQSKDGKEATISYFEHKNNVTLSKSSSSMLSKTESVEQNENFTEKQEHKTTTTTKAATKINSPLFPSSSSLSPSSNVVLNENVEDSITNSSHDRESSPSFNLFIQSRVDDVKRIAIEMRSPRSDEDDINDNHSSLKSKSFIPNNNDNFIQKSLISSRTSSSSTIVNQGMKNSLSSPRNPSLTNIKNNNIVTEMENTLRDLSSTGTVYKDSPDRIWEESEDEDFEDGL